MLAAKKLLRPGLLCGGPQDPDGSFLLLRFLRARRMDVAKAAAMWEAMVRWREGEGMAEVLAAGARGGSCLGAEEMEAARAYHPRGYHGVDKGGRPIYMELLGRAEPQRLLERVGLERYVAQRAAEAEYMQARRMPACSIAAGARIEAQTAVVDVGGVGMRSFSAAARRLLGAIQQVLGQFYPETLHCLYIVNASRGFRIVWAWIRPFLDPATVARIRILGHDFADSLLQAIDPDQLPAFLGGRCSCPGAGGCLASDIGPWNDPAILHKLLQPPPPPPPTTTTTMTSHSSSSSTRQILPRHRSFRSKASDLHLRISAVESEHSHVKRLLQEILCKQDQVLNVLRELGD
jgi:hypothetical protein